MSNKADENWLETLAETTIINLSNQQIELKVFTLIKTDTPNNNLGYLFKYNMPNHQYYCQCTIKDNELVRAIFDDIASDKKWNNIFSTYTVQNILFNGDVEMEMFNEYDDEYISNKFPIKIKICKTECDNIVVIINHTHTVPQNNHPLKHFAISGYYPDNVEFILNNNVITRKILDLLIGTNEQLLESFGISGGAMKINLIGFLKEIANYIKLLTPSNVPIVIGNTKPLALSLISGLNCCSLHHTIYDSKIIQKYLDDEDDLEKELLKY